MIWFVSLFTREYEQRHALLIIFLASSFWGVLWVPMRHIEAMGLSGLWVVVLFHFLPAFAMLPLIVRTAPSSGSDWGRAAVAGALMGAGFALYALGLVVASVTKTVILFYMTPIWSTVIAYFVLRERAGWGRWLAIAAALVGCALVTGVSRDELRFDPADLLGLLSGLFWALGSVMIRRYDGLNFVHCQFPAISIWRHHGAACRTLSWRSHTAAQCVSAGHSTGLSGVGGGVLTVSLADFPHHAICLARSCWHFDAVRGFGGGGFGGFLAWRNIIVNAMDRRWCHSDNRRFYRFL